MGGIKDEKQKKRRSAQKVLVISSLRSVFHILFMLLNIYFRDDGGSDQCPKENTFFLLN